MMIGPDPMTRTLWISVRLGIGGVPVTRSGDRSTVPPWRHTRVPRAPPGNHLVRVRSWCGRARAGLQSQPMGSMDGVNPEASPPPGAGTITLKGVLGTGDRIQIEVLERIANAATGPSTSTVESVVKFAPDTSMSAE